MVSTLWLRFQAMVDTMGLFALWYVAYVYTVGITEYLVDRGALADSGLFGSLSDPAVLFWSIWGSLVIGVVSLYYAVLWFHYKGLLYWKFDVWPVVRDGVWPRVRNRLGWNLLRRQRRSERPSLPRTAESSIWSDCENPAHL